LEAALRERGLQVELWPEFDRYDLRLRFADGEAWAVDVKDWAEPSLLARRVNAQAAPFTSGPRWSRAFFVFPQERQRERPDYVRAFENHCHVLSDGVEAAFEVDFLEEVKRKTTSTCAGGEG